MQAPQSPTLGLPGRSPVWAAALAVLAAVAAWATASALGGAPSVAPPAPATGAPQTARDYGQLPLSFERNRGQAGAGVDYLARTTTGSFMLGASGATVRLSGSGGHEATLGMRLPGASPGEPRALHRLPGRVNYLVGDQPSRWRTDIPTSGRVRYPGVWPGVDLDWHGNGRRLEYDFRVAPGIDTSTIRMHLAGARELRVARHGDLLISTRGGTIRERAPRAFQPVAGDRRPVRVSYSVSGHTVGFRVGPHDASRPLVIDPIVLAYSTYLGGNAFDAENGIAVDGSGAAYVAGSTDSTNFNLKNQIEGDGGDSNTDAVISKLVPGGNALAYSTYLGGDMLDEANAIDVDSTGHAYVTGRTTSTDFNTVNPIPGEGGDAEEDLFISKLTPQGNGLSYSTYLGGSTNDEGNGIAVDSTGAAYVTGEATSTDFDTTVGAFQAADQPSNDAFVSKLVPAGNALAYSTYLGGNLDEAGRGIALDSTGAAYVTGNTGSTNFPTVNQIEGDTSDSGQNDAFISKLTPAGNDLTYSTYLGGDGGDFGQAIGVDGSRRAYVTGSTNSTDFNLQNAIEGDGADGASDAFVSKLTTAGSALVYSTYLGGDDSDSGTGIAVDSAGSAYVAGTTSSDDFNTVQRIEGDSPGDDAFASKLAPAGNALAYSTYLGGNGEDEGHAIAVDASRAAYLAGATTSTNFDTVKPIEGNSPETDAFISKIGAPASPPGSPPPGSQPGQGQCAGKAATIVGTEGADALEGTPGPDVIAALGDKDVVRSLAGNDRVCGGGARDKLIGAGGKDKLKGGKGKDKLKGGKGKDKLSGSKGKDKLSGSKGKDKLTGGKGKDKLKGGKGKDKLSCGKGRDTAIADPGDRVKRNCERRK